MSVACEIQVVDGGALELGCLLAPNVRREHEDPIARSASRQRRAASLQLLDYDANVLIAKVPPLLHKISKDSSGSLPGGDTVEFRKSSSGRTNLGLRHPYRQSTSVRVDVRSCCLSRHVRLYSTFINNEQNKFMNNG